VLQNQVLNLSDLKSLQYDGLDLTFKTMQVLFQFAKDIKTIYQG
jgi:hypothetical protein